MTLVEQEMTIAVAATFTAEPLEQPLAHWMQELEFPARIRFAPYGQLFQSLLDASGPFLTNGSGLNVLLVKLDDWSAPRVMGEPRTGANRAEFERKARDFVAAVESAAARSRTPYLVLLCPASPATATDGTSPAVLAHIEATITSGMQEIPGVYCVSSLELMSTYPVHQPFDALLDREAHIPFTPVFYTAMATMIARRLFALVSRPYKVIVLDCDLTLWQGICGEDAIGDIAVDGPYRALQEFMAAQHEAGMLLCVCSRNNEEDVFRVFDEHPEMVLKRDHIAAWRLNWASKSENIRSLAGELNLALDSFIVVDDNPIECAEIRAAVPEVVAVQLPAEPPEIPGFINHVWAFDHLKVTAEDRARSVSYAQDAARARYEREAPTLREFLAGLELDIRIHPMSPEEAPRVAQLTHRTNQFNCTAIRRSELEIRELLGSGAFECLVVRVRDRFGDYGLVGAALFRTGAEALGVDTFLLSCRVLGRGVEHRMLRELGRIAVQREVPYVNVRFRPTGRNQPALDFLNRIACGSWRADGEQSILRLAAESAVLTTYDPDSAPREPAAREPAQAITVSDPRLHHRSQLLCRIAAELSGPELILKEMESRKHPAADSRPDGDRVPPRTPAERILCGIWSELLGIDSVGVHRSFFDMGGHSLLATQVLSRAHEAFGLELSIQDIFEAPTVAELAALIERRQIERAEPEQVLEMLKEIDGMTDDQIEAWLLQEGPQS